ncbi:MAG: NBR1-Ig-like domain-containing protein [Anaerolineaceae bacterium]
MKRIAIVLSAVLLLSSCNLVSTPTPADPMEPLRTAAAATVVAMTTQMMQTQMSVPNPMATPTTPVLTLPPLATQWVDPDQPTEASGPEATSTPSQTCDLAEFVDETVPDGTKFPPSTSFVKAWTLKNVGTCAWTSTYDAVFVGGDSMDVPAAQSLTSERILPGESVTIRMTFTTPSSSGKYRTEFQLRNTNGVLFSFNNPESTYWVDIEVTE